ncbi:DUF1446 domain-containing protein [Alteromonas sp. D210916BOD_24]|uniref:acyclic terpene utilization AtuA family protein n=1 Tax=Alteromonas sp. D210916BOD_24 TaxID=3157618 RepID=UPI00399CD171
MNNSSQKTVRIGGASAFYGDSQLSARQLVEKGDIDFLIFDYLAEVTMAILSQAQRHNNSLGYAVDFVTVAMKDVISDCAAKGIKVIANAGGVNVPGCITALYQLCEQLDLSLNIVGVYGDNILTKRDNMSLGDTQHMDTGDPLPSQLTSMNAYLGARPIADALDAGADIIVTGRVVDSALTLGPLLHTFRWHDTDYDKLAQGALAGHVLECGAQCTGGNFTDWETVPDFSDMSYPIAEVSADGSFTIGIAPETGGLVTPATVAEQILYEIGDPANYLLPDVRCDFTQIDLHQSGPNLVSVQGATGSAPGNKYKVCATYIDGFRLTGTFFMAGLAAREKALTNIRAYLKRTQAALDAQGLAPFRQIYFEVLGSEDTYGPHAQMHHTREAVAVFSLHHSDKSALQFAANEMAYLATSAAPGMAGFGAGRPKPQPFIRLHTFLLDKDQIDVIIQKNNSVIKQTTYATKETSQHKVNGLFDRTLLDEALSLLDVQDTQTLPLIELAYARSGDKGNNLNIGVIARHPQLVPVLYAQLTESAVGAFFDHYIEGSVTRFELAGLNAFNFLMTEALGGGGTASLRTDSQGKAAAQMLLTMPIQVPVSLLTYTKGGQH